MMYEYYHEPCPRIEYGFDLTVQRLLCEYCNCFSIGFLTGFNMEDFHNVGGFVLSMLQK